MIHLAYKRERSSIPHSSLSALIPNKTFIDKISEKKKKENSFFCPPENVIEQNVPPKKEKLDYSKDSSATDKPVTTTQ